MLHRVSRSIQHIFSAFLKPKSWTPKKTTAFDEGLQQGFFTRGARNVPRGCRDDEPFYRYVRRNIFTRI